MNIFSGIIRSLLLVGLSIHCGMAAAQRYPDRPIRILIPYAPGGGTDNLLRVLAPSLGAAFGQPVVIDNRPGGSTLIGTEAVTNAAPDGYTFLATDTAVLINPGLLKSKVPFDTVKSLTGVTMMATAPVLLVVHPSVPSKTLSDLLTMARAKPGALNYGSGGLGTANHLAAELMKFAANVDIMHIPYKGSGPAMAALLAGQVQMSFLGISSARQYVESGRLRAIAVTGKQRNSAMPDVPTFEESGLAGVEADSYWGVYAPVGVPPRLLDIVSRNFARAMREPVNAERLAGLGFLTIGNNPQEHTEQMRAMVRRWIDIIDKARIQAE